MVFDKKEWRKEYLKKNRDKINSYYRDYYNKNKLKHIAIVKKWKENNMDKFNAYQDKLKAPEERAKRRIYLNEWRMKNRQHLIDYNKLRYEKIKAAQELLETGQSSSPEC